MSGDRRADDQRLGVTAGAGFLLLACGVLAAVGLQHGIGFWGTSDGVYALTAREVLHGARLYHDVAAAQPPPVYLFGAAALAVSDGLTSLRVGLELVQLASAALVMGAVWRLTRARWVAAGAGVLAPLLPLTLTQNALLTPETLATPLLLGAAICGASSGNRRPVLAAGLLAALAVSLKLAFAIPALAVLAGSHAPRRAVAALAAAAAALAAAGLAVYGGALWRSIVTAQLQTGTQSPHDVAGLWAQAAWIGVPLVLAALIALRARERCQDPRLLRGVTTGAIGSLLLLASVIKAGSYINVMAVAEPFLLILAASGIAWLWQSPRGKRATRARRAQALLAAAAAVSVAQSASILITPGDPGLATRPLARSGPREILSAAGVRAAVAAASRCQAHAAYPGIAFIAFVAHRRVPGDQPDTFILGVGANARFATIAERDRNRCPRRVPMVDARGDVTSPG